METPMGHRFLDLITSPAARVEQATRGSRAAYARGEGAADHNDRLSGAEAAFIAERDSFYLASVTPDGWPYIQHRGGPVGFLQVLDDRHVGFADYRGNRQYLTLGNITEDDRVALFLMDYPNRRRLKLLGRMRALAAEDDLPLAARLGGPASTGRVERLMTITVEGFDWNCPQHITPRYTVDDLAPVAARLAALEAENAELKGRLAQIEGAAR
jgi:predicted pyridoxine 5'-phosphate oxidase superfamily flavin-nucleotide-binding protein